MQIMNNIEVNVWFNSHHMQHTVIHSWFRELHAEVWVTWWKQMAYCEPNDPTYPMPACVCVRACVCVCVCVHAC